METPRYEDQIVSRVLLGRAGTGKSTALRQLEKEHKLLLTATTGVAAYNLGEGCTTINSLMGFFNAESLRENMNKSSWLSYKYEQLKDYNGVAIEEVSMASAEMLDLLTSCFLQLSRWRINEGLDPLKILLVGDFLQLPPVARESVVIPYAFQGQWWNLLYEPNVTTLKTVYRQQDPAYQAILEYARRGVGFEAAASLKQSGCSLANMPWYNFPGFTLYPTNASVQVHNRTRLAEIDDTGYSLVAERWGEQTDDLKEVPDTVALKNTCRVRITANDSFADGSPSFVNGQLGSLISYEPDPKGSFRNLEVLLDKPDSSPQDDTTYIPKVTRFALKPTTNTSEEQKLIAVTGQMKSEEFKDYLHNHLIPNKIVPFWHPQREKIAIGAVRYYPVILGYASTFHKSQGLQFNQLQIDFRNRFAGENQMMYVALSRCRTLEGLLLAGDFSKLARRINTSPQVAKYI